VTLAAFEPIFASFRRLLGPAIYETIWPDWRTAQREAVESLCDASGDSVVLVAGLGGAAMRRKVLRRASTLVLALLVLAAAGCARDEDLVEVLLTAQCSGVSARVWMPVNEPRSTGTYRGEIVWQDGTSHSVSAKREGMLGDVWLADLCGDGTPELVVTCASAGSGSYGTVDVYRYEAGRVVEVDVAPLDAEQSTGYMGHDSFFIDDGRLYRSHPVYADGDPNAEPTGGQSSFWYSFADSTWVRPTADRR